MKDYVSIDKYDGTISLCFYIENDKPFSIGEKMEEICGEAYMNGYNWEAFLNYYLEENAPELLEGLDTDPEAGMYAAYYEFTAENEKKAQRFGEIICDLIENDDKLFAFLKEKSENIEWD